MKKIGILIRKEMLDILRDKKTLIMMVIVPIVLYPLLLIGMTLVMSSIMSTPEDVVYGGVYLDGTGSGTKYGGRGNRTRWKERGGNRSICLDGRGNDKGVGGSDGAERGRV